MPRIRHIVPNILGFKSFFIKNKLDSYKEGDNVIVGVYIDMNAATDNGYNIKELEKEYVLIEQENNQ